MQWKSEPHKLSEQGHSSRWGRQLIASLCLLATSVAVAPTPALSETFQIGTADGSFETGFTGMETEGSVEIVPSFGSVQPTEGQRALLMTTEPPPRGPRRDLT